MPLQASGLGDLLAATLPDLGEMKITEITSDLQDHVAMRVMLKRDRITLDSGTAIQWDIMVGNSQAASFVGLYATDNVNVADTLIQASIPWRHYTTNYAFDEREIAMNRNPRRIVDLLKIRRFDCMVALAELMEAAFWGFPASTDTVTPYGVAYWIVKNATEGFNGGAQTGYTAVAGVNPSTYTRWKNYTAQYTNVSKDDFVRKIRKASIQTNFRAPAEGVSTFNTGDNFVYCTNYSVLGKLEELLEAQNDDLGNDVASMDGNATFRRRQVMWVPFLDRDTTDPFYGINFGVFKTAIMRDWWLRETRITVTPGQHTVASVHVDGSFNWICRDRRRQFVVATGTTYP